MAPADITLQRMVAEMCRNMLWAGHKLLEWIIVHCSREVAVMECLGSHANQLGEML